MNYQIDTKSDKTAYIQLYDELAHDIAMGVYPYNSKLPSKRLIASETGLSVITVQHALDLLAEEGYIRSVQRSGNFVTFKSSDLVSDTLRVKDTPNTPAILHHPPTDGSISYSLLSKTMRKVLLDHGDNILIKSPNHGLPELRSQICSYLARSRGLVVEPSQVIIGSGAEYLYVLVAQFFKDKKTIAIEDPSYDKIKKVYSSMGLTVRELPIESHGISRKALKNTDANVLHVTPFNSFPSGVSIDISGKLEYLNWAEARNGFIVEDNYDSELTVSARPEDTLFSLSGGRRVIYLNTFSKTVTPSLRMGYMVLPRDIIDEFNEKLGFYSCTVPVFEQLVVSELLKSGNYERHINRIRREKRNKLH